MKVLMSGSRSKINREVEKAFYSLLDRKSLDLDTVMLFVLHSIFGFGADRARRYYESYVENFKVFYSNYEEAAYDRMRNDLKKYGIEVEMWYRELVAKSEK